MKHNGLGKGSLVWGGVMVGLRLCVSASQCDIADKCAMGLSFPSSSVPSEKRMVMLWSRFPGESGVDDVGLSGCTRLKDLKGAKCFSSFYMKTLECQKGGHNKTHFVTNDLHDVFLCC